jgi:hypothetical protein
MTSNSPAEKIYITYKTRMLTEARLMKDAKFYNGLIAWYSFWLIAFSMSQLFGIYRADFANLMFAIASVAIFGLSLYVGGQKYSERAEQFRSCYLQLKELYESGRSVQAKMARYAAILKLFENQTDDDFDEMVFDAVRRGQILYDSSGSLALTKHTEGKVRRKKLWRWLSKATLVIAPAIMLFGLSWMEETHAIREIESPAERIGSPEDEAPAQIPETIRGS